MERRKLIQLMVGTAAVGLMPGLTGCVVEGGGYRPVPAPRPIYRPPEYYNYYYYPEVAVYFQIQTGYYWYYSHGAWRRSRRLPSYIHLRGPRRIIVIRDRNPYDHYREHSHRYGRPDRGYGPEGEGYEDRRRRGEGDHGDNQGRGRNDNIWNNGQRGRQPDYGGDQGSGRQRGGNGDRRRPTGNENGNGGNGTPRRGRSRLPLEQQPQSTQPSRGRPSQPDPNGSGRKGRARGTDTGQPPNAPNNGQSGGNANGNGKSNGNGNGNGGTNGKKRTKKGLWPWLQDGEPAN